MRLPAIREGEVQSLGRQDIHGPMRVGNARARAAVAVREGVQQVAGQYLDVQRKKELDDAALYATQKSLDWKASNKDRDYYRGDEVDDNIPVRKTTFEVDEQRGIVAETVRKDIPAYEVQPDMYNTYMKGVIEAASSGINNTEDRNQFIRNLEESMAVSYGKMKVQSAMAQKSHIRTEQDLFITEATQQREYGIAAAAIENFNGTEEEKEVMRRKLDLTVELDGYNDIVSDALVADDPVAVDVSLREIDGAIGVLNDDEYQGSLDTKTRVAVIKQLQILNNTLGNRGDAAIKENQAWMRYRAANAIEALNSGKGYTVNPMEYTAIHDAVSQFDPILAAKMTQAGAFSDNYSDMSMMAPIQQNAILANMKSRIKTPEDAVLYNDLQKMQQKMQGELNANSLEYATQVGFTSRTSLNFGSPKDSIESMAGRRKEINRIHQQFGITNAFLYDDELNQMTSMVENMTPEQRLSFAGQVHMALGDQSHLLYEQLRVNGVTGSFPIAGQILAEGDQISANAIIIGENWRQDNPDFIKQAEPKVKQFLLNKFRNAYPMQGGKAQSMLSAGIAAYAYLAGTNGDVKTEYDENTAEIAYNMVTGGLIEFEGSTFEAPYRGMAQTEFENYIKELTPSAVGLMGDAKGWNNSQISTALKNGDLRLIGYGKNKYALYDPALRTFVETTANDLFTFRYNPEGPTVTSEKTKAQADYLAPGGGYDQNVAKHQKEFAPKNVMEGKASKFIADKAKGFVTNFKSTAKNAQEMAKKNLERQRESETYVDEKGRIKTRYVGPEM